MIHARDSHILEELQDLRKNFKDFCSNVSNHLQDSLRNIRGHVSLIEAHSVSFDEKNKTCFKFIKENTDKAQAILNGLSTYATLLGEERTFKILSLKDPFEAALLDLDDLIKKTKSTVQTKLCPVEILGEGALLKQAFKNILENAFTYSKSTPRILVTFEKKIAQYLITIKDHGLGIPEAYHKKIFEPFERLQSYDQYPGIGLGLTMAKKIIEIHHGRIWIESAGSGTTVCLALPLRA